MKTDTAIIAPPLGRFAVGDVVILKNDLYEPANEYEPGGYLAYKGEKLIVRKMKIDYSLPWTDPLAISVSHTGRTDDNTFVVRHSEIYHHMAEFTVITHYDPWKIILKMSDTTSLTFDVNDIFVMDGTVKSIYDLSTAKINNSGVQSVLTKHKKYVNDILEFTSCKQKLMTGVIHCPYIPASIDTSYTKIEQIIYKDTKNVK